MFARSTCRLCYGSLYAPPAWQSVRLAVDPVDRGVAWARVPSHRGRSSASATPGGATYPALFLIECGGARPKNYLCRARLIVLHLKHEPRTMIQRRKEGRIPSRTSNGGGGGKDREAAGTWARQTDPTSLLRLRLEQSSERTTWRGVAHAIFCER